MNSLLLDLLPEINKGYCCSQLLLSLAQRQFDDDNPEFMAAMAGLCHGIGRSGGPCGLLTAGAAVLSWIISKVDPENSMREPMLNDYATWFVERTQSYGGIDCDSIASGIAAQVGSPIQSGEMPNMEACGDLLAECWYKILEICENYNLS